MTAQPSLPLSLMIRPARLTDRAGVEAIAARNWDGRDYLPHVFERWLNDASGEFYVATVTEAKAEVVIGTGKVSCLGEGEWWLEGLRVHHDYRQRGIGRTLHLHGMNVALRTGSGVLRMSTDLFNEAVHRYAAETAFTVAQRYLRYDARAYATQFGAEQFTVLTTDDVPMVGAFLSGSAFFERCQRGTMGRAWKCHLLTPQRLAAWCAEGNVFGWRQPTRYRNGTRRGIDGVVIVGHAPALTSATVGEMDVTYLDAIPGSFGALARSVRGLAGKQGYARLRFMLPTAPSHQVAIEQGGWRRPRDNSGQAVLFSRALRR